MREGGFLHIGPVFLNRLVYGDLVADAGGVSGKSGCEVIPVGIESKRLAEKEFMMNHVERGVGVGLELAETTEILLGDDPFTAFPAPRLIHANHRRELIDREAFSIRQEDFEIGSGTFSQRRAS